MRSATPWCPFRPINSCWRISGEDPEFRSSLDLALADGVKRVSRLINQLRFLARDSLATSETFPVAPLIEEAYQEACKYQPANPPSCITTTKISPLSSMAIAPR